MSEESQLLQDLREDLGNQHTISLMTFLPFGFPLFFSLEEDSKTDICTPNKLFLHILYLLLFLLEELALLSPFER